MTTLARPTHSSLVTTCLLVAACRPPSATPDLPLCPPLEVAAPSGESPRPAVWRALLLSGPDRQPRQSPPWRACTGELIAPVPDPCEPRLGEPVPLAALDDRDLVFGEAGDGKLLVWAITHHSPTGDGLGPVALVQYSAASIAVQALGMLEAPPTGTVLSLLDAGAGRYLVAEGERCPDAAPNACIREARILALDGRRFVPSAYYDANATCLESPRLPLFRRSPVPGSDTRIVVDRRMIAADPQGLFFQEELEIFDGDRLLRRAAESRRVDYRDGRLIVSAPSLWARLAAQSPESPA